MLAAKLVFIDSYYFLLVQLLNDLYQQSLFACSCSKRAQGSAIKHQQGINAIPPFPIFPRVHFKDFMLHNSPPGTIGVAHNSGWMQSTNFKAWLDHFIKH